MERCPPPSPTKNKPTSTTNWFGTTLINNPKLPQKHYHLAVRDGTGSTPLGSRSVFMNLNDDDLFVGEWILQRPGIGGRSMGRGTLFLPGAGK